MTLQSAFRLAWLFPVVLIAACQGPTYAAIRLDFDMAPVAEEDEESRRGLQEGEREGEGENRADEGERAEGREGDGKANPQNGQAGRRRGTQLPDRRRTRLTGQQAMRWSDFDQLIRKLKDGIARGRLTDGDLVDVATVVSGAVVRANICATDRFATVLNTCIEKEYPHSKVTRDGGIVVFERTGQPILSVGTDYWEVIRHELILTIARDGGWKVRLIIEGWMAPNLGDIPPSTAEMRSMETDLRYRAVLNDYADRVKERLGTCMNRGGQGSH